MAQAAAAVVHLCVLHWPNTNQHALSPASALQGASIPLQARQSAEAVRSAQEVGAGILQQLHAQRQTIQHAQQRQQDTNAQLKQADGILQRMSRWWPG